METEQQSGYLEQGRQPFTRQNSSRLVPYANLGDEWSLPDEFILSVPHRMAEEGSFQKVFYDGRVRSDTDFLDLMQNPANVPVFYFSGSEPMGFAWLNGFNGGIAFAHFCGFRASKHRTEEIGRAILDYWMANFSFLQVILGLTPGNNKLAQRFITKIGFTVLGDIPNVLFDAYEGERVSAVVSYYAR